MSENVNIRELNELVAGKSGLSTSCSGAWTRQLSVRNTSWSHSSLLCWPMAMCCSKVCPVWQRLLPSRPSHRLLMPNTPEYSSPPDLLPADVTGTMIYSVKNESFQIKRGPIFANFVLADEINRAPAKVQSSLLEAMQERQVTIGDSTFALPEPFLVMATQNPIEQEGTYPLPRLRSTVSSSRLSSATRPKMMSVSSYART